MALRRSSPREARKTSGSPKRPSPPRTRPGGPLPGSRNALLRDLGRLFQKRSRSSTARRSSEGRTSREGSPTAAAGHSSSPQRQPVVPLPESRNALFRDLGRALQAQNPASNRTTTVRRSSRVRRTTRLRGASGGRRTTRTRGASGGRRTTTVRGSSGGRLSTTNINTGGLQMSMGSSGTGTDFSSLGTTSSSGSSRGSLETGSPVKFNKYGFAVVRGEKKLKISDFLHKPELVGGIRSRESLLSEFSKMKEHQGPVEFHPTMTQEEFETTLRPTEEFQYIASSGQVLNIRNTYDFPVKIIGKGGGLSMVRHSGKSSGSSLESSHTPPRARAGPEQNRATSLPGRTGTPKRERSDFSRRKSSPGGRPTQGSPVIQILQRAKKFHKLGTDSVRLTVDMPANERGEQETVSPPRRRSGRTRTVTSEDRRNRRTRTKTVSPHRRTNKRTRTVTPENRIRSVSPRRPSYEAGGPPAAFGGSRPKEFPNGRRPRRRSSSESPIRRRTRTRSRRRRSRSTSRLGRPTTPGRRSRHLTPRLNTPATTQPRITTKVLEGRRLTQILHETPGRTSRPGSPRRETIVVIPTPTRPATPRRTTRTITPPQMRHAVPSRTTAIVLAPTRQRRKKRTVIPVPVENAVVRRKTRTVTPTPKENVAPGRGILGTIKYLFFGSEPRRPTQRRILRPVITPTRIKRPVLIPITGARPPGFVTINRGRGLGDLARNVARETGHRGVSTTRGTRANEPHPHMVWNRDHYSVGLLDVKKRANTSHPIVVVSETQRPRGTKTVVASLPGTFTAAEKMAAVRSTLTGKMPLVKPWKNAEIV